MLLISHYLTMTMQRGSRSLMSTLLVKLLNGTIIRKENTYVDGKLFISSWD